MAFRFWRRIRLFPGVTLNLSKSTASLSFGPRGAKYTVSPRGNRATAGIPGTGLFYTVKDPGDRPRRTGGATPDAPHVPVKDRLSLGFFKRLVTPAGEEAFVDGLRALHEGDENQALRHLEDAAYQPDAAWMAGILCLKREELDRAERHLRAALNGARTLGSLYEKYGLMATISLPVTDEVTAHIRPRRRGTLLALAELYQLRGDARTARQTLEELLADTPDDVVAQVSLAELLLDEEPVPPGSAEAIVRMAADIENDTPVHAALLLYKARALRALGLDDAAVKTFTVAYRRKKDRADDLLRQIRYERALAYEAVGRKSRARRELEAIYAEAPDFEDVADRLGLGSG